MLYVNFNAYANYVTDSLYQWDINQDLIINGLNLPTAPEIHFSNAGMNGAIVRQSTVDDGVIIARIPNSLLQHPLTIRAYVGVYEGDTFKIVECLEIPIISRPMPLNYTFVDSDDEIYSFNRLENQIANIVANNNDTEGNSELVDIRVDYEGKVHPSAGEAIRAQIAKLAKAPGGSTPYFTTSVFNITVSGSLDGDLSCTATVAEVEEALNNGASIIVKFIAEDMLSVKSCMCMNLTGYYESEYGQVLKFYAVAFDIYAEMTLTPQQDGTYTAEYRFI